MPINTITQTISELPEAGRRGIDVQTQFVIKQEDFQDHLQGTTVTELNTLKDQLNTRISEINSTTATMNGYADTASAGASTATTKAGEASTSASEALASRNQASTFATNSSNSATKSSQWADNNYNIEVETGKYSAKHWSTVAQNTVANKIDKVTSTDNAIVRFDGTTGAVQNSGVIVDDNNNVGIGVAPMRKFQIHDASLPIIQLTNSTTGSADANRGGLIYQSGSDMYFINKESGGIYLGNNGLAQATIDSIGNLLLTSGTGALGYGTGAGGTVTQLTNKSTAVTLNKPCGQIVTSNSALAAGTSVNFYCYNSIYNPYTDNILLALIDPVSSYGAYSVEIGGSSAAGLFVIKITNKTGSTLSDALIIRFSIIKGALS